MGPVLSCTRHDFINAVGPASEYVTLVFLVLVQVIANLVNPIALEQFLRYGSDPQVGISIITHRHMPRYLETQGKGATIQPIVWIILLFLGPIAFSISYQWSIFIEVSHLAACGEHILVDAHLL